MPPSSHCARSIREPVPAEAEARARSISHDPPGSGDVRLLGACSILVGTIFASVFVIRQTHCEMSRSCWPRHRAAPATPSVRWSAGCSSPPAHSPSSRCDAFDAAVRREAQRRSELPRTDPARPGGPHQALRRSASALGVEHVGAERARPLAAAKPRCPSPSAPPVVSQGGPRSCAEPSSGCRSQWCRCSRDDVAAVEHECADLATPGAAASLVAPAFPAPGVRARLLPQHAESSPSASSKVSTTIMCRHDRQAS